ncbi:hypothetical protein ABZP36_014124 [Zizania latifolia]
MVRLPPPSPQAASAPLRQIWRLLPPFPPRQTAPLRPSGLRPSPSLVLARHASAPALPVALRRSLTASGASSPLRPSRPPANGHPRAARLRRSTPCGPAQSIL